MGPIGLLADSHGRAATTRHAVQLLLDHGARLLLHLGDVGTVEVLDALVATAAGQTEPVQAHVVFGNCDWDHQALTRYARTLGIAVDHPVGRMDVAGGALVFCHGHENEQMRRALADGARYLCHGHTHQRADQRQGSTRIINPGALFRAAEYSVAVLDCAADEVRFIPVPH